MDMVKQNNENCLLFNDKVTFHDLKPNFEIDLMAYELALENVSLKGENKKHRELFTYIGKAEFNLGDRDKNYKTFTNYSTFGGSKLIHPGINFDFNVRAQHLPYFSGLFHVRYLDKNGIFTWMCCFIEISDGFIRFWKNQNNFDQKLQSFSVIDIYNICSQDIQKLNCDQQFY